MNSRKIENYIEEILKAEYGDEWSRIYERSPLLKYLNLKSGAIHGSVKSRRSLANWYAIYSILHFYLEKGFLNKRELYSECTGFNYSDLFEFQRKQYGGSKLQNHALNNRVNTEFADKITHEGNKLLIINNGGKYLINPDYIYIDDLDISETVVKIIERYKEMLYKKDHNFEDLLNRLVSEKDKEKQIQELKQLLDADSEARIFEIISYAILETHYDEEFVYIGYTRESIKKEALKLYKTGRTNANDGGIDFVMRPLGRFFQVTEVGNYDKYFLDIDKINRYPLTFVVKTKLPASEIKQELIEYGISKSGGLKVLENKYKEAVEEVITINELIKWLDEVSENRIGHIVKEVDQYYKFEMDLM